MPGPWRQQYFLIHVGNDMQLNDLGFQDRNNFLLGEWETGYRQDNLPADSMFAATSTNSNGCARPTTWPDPAATASHCNGVRKCAMAAACLRSRAGRCRRGTTSFRVAMVRFAVRMASSSTSTAFVRAGAKAGSAGSPTSSSRPTCTRAIHSVPAHSPSCMSATASMSILVCMASISRTGWYGRVRMTSAALNRSRRTVLEPQLVHQ